MIIQHFVDDFGGEGDATTVRFSLKSVSYAIDLNEENQQRLFDALAPFIEKARIGPNANKTEGAAARAWAIENKLMKPASRGATPKSILDKYEKAIQRKK